MSGKAKASPATRRANDVENGGSEKKRGRKNGEKKDVMKTLFTVGYVCAGIFILAALFQVISSSSDIKNANMLHAQNMVEKRIQEEERARAAIEKELNVNIKDGGVIIKKEDAPDSMPVDVQQGMQSTSPTLQSGDGQTGTPDSALDDGDSYEMLENGDVVHTNKKGKKTVYHICTTCSKCGEITKKGVKCAKCGSNLYKYVVYKVKKGDTLSEISGKTGASVRKIANLNEIDNVNLIYTGESLRIPD